MGQSTTDDQDLKFLRALKDAPAKETEYFASEVSTAIKTIEEALSKDRKQN
jgi:hypothetical protein